MVAVQILNKGHDVIPQRVDHFNALQVCVRVYPLAGWGLTLPVLEPKQSQSSFEALEYHADSALFAPFEVLRCGSRRYAAPQYIVPRAFGKGSCRKDLK